MMECRQEFELYTFSFLIHEQKVVAVVVIFLAMCNSCTIRLLPAGHSPGVSCTYLFIFLFSSALPNILTGG